MYFKNFDDSFYQRLDNALKQRLDNALKQRQAPTQRSEIVKHYKCEKNGNTLEYSNYEKRGDTYYFDVRGCEKETICCEIVDGKLNIVATGKIGDREYNYDYSIHVGEASQYEINCEYTAGVLAIELKKKHSKQTININ